MLTHFLLIRTATLPLRRRATDLDHSVAVVAAILGWPHLLIILTSDPHRCYIHQPSWHSRRLSLTSALQDLVKQTRFSALGIADKELLHRSVGSLRLAVPPTIKLLLGQNAIALVIHQRHQRGQHILVCMQSCQSRQSCANPAVSRSVLYASPFIIPRRTPFPVHSTLPSVTSTALPRINLHAAPLVLSHHRL
ncbi:hypothetical protein BCV70DRAFT_18752 [Testicularia cyperi]|uniref:Uncharacterized protein n=1 Tax=Testicularia cyperi TaxID=1882483 RepID=A0A317XZH2_9BASI|nr:hypothetical protein BCV70DRAFT_18752 [Testicularia cyperi]